MYNISLDADKLTRMLDCVKGRRVRLTRPSPAARVGDMAKRRLGALSKNHPMFVADKRLQTSVVRCLFEAINDKARDALCAMRVVQPVDRRSVLFVCTCHEDCLQCSISSNYTGCSEKMVNVRKVTMSVVASKCIS